MPQPRIAALSAAVLILAWLLPGAALWVGGLKKRASVVFALVQLTFLMGCALRGSIFLPDLHSGADGFNIVAVLVFLISMGNGGLGALSLLGDLSGGTVALLPINEAHDYADLGQMFLLVSGGLNYFLVMSGLNATEGPEGKKGKGTGEPSGVPTKDGGHEA